jgi:hypothetical protein
MLGKLVRINRASIGVPKGTLGVVMKELKGAVWEGEEDLPAPVIYEVLLCGKRAGAERRYLVNDLEVVAE